MGKRIRSFCLISCYARTHSLTHARTRARTSRARARTHTHTHTHTRTRLPPNTFQLCYLSLNLGKGTKQVFAIVGALALTQPLIWPHDRRTRLISNPCKYAKLAEQAWKLSVSKSLPYDWSFPAQPISSRKAQSRRKSSHTFAHLVNFSKKCVCRI